MAGNPRIVTADAVFTWDHASQRLPRGQVLDVPPGSALEEAIGTEKLVPMFGAPPAAPAPPPVAPPPATVPQPAASKPAEAPAPKSPAKAPAKDSSDEKGGQS